MIKKEKGRVGEEIKKEKGIWLGAVIKKVRGIE